MEGTIYPEGGLGKIGVKYYIEGVGYSRLICNGNLPKYVNSIVTNEYGSVSATKFACIVNPIEFIIKKAFTGGAFE